MIFKPFKIKFSFDFFKPNNQSLNPNESKKASLLFTFVKVWLGIALFLITAKWIQKSTFFHVDIYTHIFSSTMLLFSLFLHKQEHRKAAYILFIISSIFSIFFFCNVVAPRMMKEFFYILFPPIILIFIDHRATKYFLVFLAYFCFMLPNLFLQHYPITEFNDPTQTILYFSVFIMVNYFKNLNTKSENKLKEVNRKKSQFFINLAHELKTPLTLMNGQIDFLEESLVIQTPESKLATNKLKRQLDKISSIVNDIMDLGKIEDATIKLRLESVNLSALIHKLFISFESNFKQKNIEFSYDSSNPIIYVDVSYDYLERAIGNVILNALKYTENNGNVHISLIEQDQMAILKVQDDGIGVSEKERDQIFDRFYQIDNDINSSGGSGIGLAFSKEILQLHQGSIRCLKGQEQGATFELLIPISTQHISQQTKQSRAIKQQLSIRQKVDTLENFKILLVDDNPEMRDYLKTILNACHCTEAENGLEALKNLENHQYDLILVDYMMPKMNGLEFLKALKKQNNQIPVVMLTARNDMDSRLNVLQVGLQDYIQKPFNKKELLIRIYNVLHNQKERLSYADKHQLKTVEIDKSLSWIEKVAQYVHQHCSDLDMEQPKIADHFGVTEKKLYRDIKAATGLSPNTFITEIKLQKARGIKENTPDVSLKKLSLEVGFKHSHYFSKLYEKRFGCKP